MAKAQPLAIEPPGGGFSLKGALKNCAEPRLYQEYERRRSTPGVEKSAAFSALAADLVARFVRGELMAWASHRRPAGPRLLIPAEEWGHLQIDGEELSRVRRGRIHHHDVRVHLKSAIEALHQGITIHRAIGYLMPDILESFSRNWVPIMIPGDQENKRRRETGMAAATQAIESLRELTASRRLDLKTFSGGPEGTWKRLSKDALAGLQISHQSLYPDDVDVGLPDGIRIRLRVFLPDMSEPSLVESSDTGGVRLKVKQRIAEFWDSLPAQEKNLSRESASRLNLLLVQRYPKADADTLKREFRRFRKTLAQK